MNNTNETDNMNNINETDDMNYVYSTDMINNIDSKNKNNIEKVNKVTDDEKDRINITEDTRNNENRDSDRGINDVNNSGKKVDDGKISDKNMDMVEKNSKKSKEKSNRDKRNKEKRNEKKKNKENNTLDSICSEILKDNTVSFKNEVKIIKEINNNIEVEEIINYNDDINSDINTKNTNGFQNDRNIKNVSIDNEKDETNIKNKKENKDTKEVKTEDRIKKENKNIQRDEKVKKEEKEKKRERNTKENIKREIIAKREEKQENVKTEVIDKKEEKVKMVVEKKEEEEEKEKIKIVGKKEENIKIEKWMERIVKKGEIKTENWKERIEIQGKIKAILKKGSIIYHGTNANIGDNIRLKEPSYFADEKLASWYAFDKEIGRSMAGKIISFEVKKDIGLLNFDAPETFEYLRSKHNDYPNKLFEYCFPLSNNKVISRKSHLVYDLQLGKWIHSKGYNGYLYKELPGFHAEIMICNTPYLERYNLEYRLVNFKQSYYICQTLNGSLAYIYINPESFYYTWSTKNYYDPNPNSIFDKFYFDHNIVSFNK